MKVTPQLPAIHFEVAPRIVKTSEQLCTLRHVNAIKYQEPQWFLDADGNWFEGTISRIIRRTPLWMRWWDDYIFVQLEFNMIENPLPEKKLERRLCYGLDPDLPNYKALRAEFRALDGTPALIDWLVKNDATMRPFNAAWNRPKR